MTVLYGVAPSPYVRKVIIALTLKGIEYQHETVMPAFGDNQSAVGAPDDWDAISPIGLVPAFRDEHVAISDSSVICEYLDARYPAKPLQPTDPAARARSHWYEEYADTALSNAVMTVFRERVVRHRMMGLELNEELIKEQMETKEPKAFDYLEQQLKGVEYLVDNRLTMADISVLSPIINMYHAEHSIDAKRWKNLDAFYRRMTDMPVIADIVAKEQEILNPKAN